MNQKNGQQVHPTQEQVAAADAALQRIRPIIQGAVHPMIRGILMSCQGIPPNIVASSIAFEVGNFMAQVFQGDIGTLTAIRAGLRDAFEEGVRKAPLLQPASNWQPPQGAPPLTESD